MVDDAYDIIAAVAATADGRVAICEKQTLTALCQAVANRCYRMFVVSCSKLLLSHVYCFSVANHCCRAFTVSL